MATTLSEMSDNNIKILLVGAVIAVLLGCYKIGQSVYTTLLWEKTEGVVVDFERSVWTCGKWVNECYDLVVRYEVYEKPYRLVSDKRFNEKAPTHLLNTPVGLYYRPGNPAEAVLAGTDGPLGYGMALLVFGILALLIVWYLHRRHT